MSQLLGPGDEEIGEYVLSYTDEWTAQPFLVTVHELRSS